MINKENVHRFIVGEAEIEVIPFSETEDLRLKHELVGQLVRNYVDEYACTRTGIQFKEQSPTCSRGVLVYDEYAGATGYNTWRIFNFEKGTIIEVQLNFYRNIIGVKGYYIYMQGKETMGKESVVMIQ